MSGGEFMARIAALVPSPRHPLLRYHGVFAPGHSWRKLVVPKPCQLVRNTDGNVVANPTPEMRARTTEGQGTVVVSLVIVARRGLTAVTNLGDANQICGALSERDSLDADTLVALEVAQGQAQGPGPAPLGGGQS